MGQRKKPRILLYSHDTFGLGHLRRSLAIAEQIACDIPRSHQLLLTGSMVAGAFDVPPRFDMVKLPALSKRSSGKYQARTLPLSLDATIAWREQMILQSAINFAPDVILIDKAPAGAQGEVLPMLRHFKKWSPNTRLVFGMRDIEDAPVKTRQQWSNIAAYRLFEEIYDTILLYGQRSVFDPVNAYELSPQASGKVIETGYLGRKPPQHDTSWVRHKVGISAEKPLILVTVGGGGDGYAIIETVMQMIKARPTTDLHFIIVTGPLMARAERSLAHAADALPHTTLIEFTPDLFDYMAQADLVVSMAGYNTTVELLSLGKRAVLIPRKQVRAEQTIRAERLAQLGLVQQLALDALSADNLHAAIARGLAQPAPTIPLNLDGLPAVSRALADCLSNRRTAARSPKLAPVFA